MSSLLHSVLAKTLFLVALGGVAATGGLAQAAPDFDLFGREENIEMKENDNGICAATSLINGLIYLQNAYPSIYGSTKLTTGNEAGANAQYEAMRDLAWNNWTAPDGTAREGYYAACSTTKDLNDAWARCFWETMIHWNEDFAPGRTSYSAQAVWTDTSKWMLGGNVSSEKPTSSFLQSAIGKNKFVELVIYPDDFSFSFGHAVNLLSISDDWTTITYQDPNTPNIETTETLSVIGAGNPAAGFLRMGWNGGGMIIAGAFAEAAIPEPSTIVLLVIGFAGVSAYLWRRRNRTAS